MGVTINIDGFRGESSEKMFLRQHMFYVNRRVVMDYTGFVQICSVQGHWLSWATSRTCRLSPVYDRM